MAVLILVPLAEPDGGRPATASMHPPAAGALIDGGLPQVAQVSPVWTVAVEAGEEFITLLARYRAGRVSPEEVERVYRTRVFPALVDAADCMDIAQAVMRRGPEAPRASDLMRQRQHRLSERPRFRLLAA